ncbi:uncharacterized protein METZ01_LOCUS245646 [marine metagenome]|uniref:Uncharacterized protein n=1 Tax=marine metagenome TaxID=408172 RepID=A0A382I0D4_9ZZZZ
MVSKQPRRRRVLRDDQVHPPVMVEVGQRRPALFAIDTHARLARP